MGRSRNRKWQRRLRWPWERYCKLRKAAPYIVWLMANRMREAAQSFKESVTEKLFE